MNIPFTDGLTLLSPWMGLVVLAALVVLLILMIVRRKKRPAVVVRHTNVALLHSVIKEVKPSRWRKVAIPLLVITGLLVLAFGAARPATAVETAKEEAHMCLILDKSLSMLASDVNPTRIDAMKQAARATIQQSPADLKILVVAFAGADQIEIVIEPSLNRDEALERIENLQMADGTAIGEGIFTAIDVLSSLEDSPLRSAEELSEGDEPPVACVLLSDGTSVDGRPPFEAAQAAAELGIPIHTVAFGTDEGVAPVGDMMISVKPDRQTLQQIAETTGGDFYEAVSSDELEQIFDSVTTRVATETDYQDVGYIPTVLGALLVLSGLTLSVLRNGRMYI